MASIFNNLANAAQSPLANLIPGGSLVQQGIQTGGLLGQVIANSAQTPQSSPTQAITSSGGSSTAASSGSRAAAPTYDEAGASYYDNTANQLNNQLGQLDRQQDIGLSNLSNSYNSSANRLDQQKAVANRDYNTNLQSNQRSYLNNRNSILNNTRATQNALQRLLGLNGAGNSSAAYESAPYAAGLQGSQNLGQAQDTYATNGQKLDTNWQDTLRNYQNSLDDLNTQKYQQENSLRASIAQTRANLLDQIGQARGNAALSRGQNYQQAQAIRTPFQNQVNDLLGMITGLGNQYANPVLRTGDLNYAAPELSQYSLGEQVAPTQSGGPQSNVNPIFANLIGQRRDQFGNVIG